MRVKYDKSRTSRLYFQSVWCLNEITDKLNNLLKTHNESTAGNLTEYYQNLMGVILSTIGDYTVELNNLKDNSLKVFHKATAEASK